MIRQISTPYSFEENPQQGFTIQVVMTAEVSDDRVQGSNPNRIVSGDSDVVYLTFEKAESNVTPGLSADFVPKPNERSHKIRRGKVSWQSHKARTSSRTMCNRTNRGASSESGK